MYMSQKNNKPKRAFIPQNIGDMLKKINRKYTNKFGRLEFIIQSKWSDIAGSYFAKFSEPKSITRISDYKDEYGEKVFKNYLNVSVASAAALEFQHYRNTIIEKINSHFGYKAIVDIRITQSMYIKSKNASLRNFNHNKLTDNDKNDVFSKVEKMKNSELKSSLIDLGFNITKLDNND